MKAALTGGIFGDVPVEVPASREQAKEFLTRAVNEYSHWMRSLDGSDFGEPVQLPFGTMPRGQCVTMPVLDLVHHHGQICYILLAGLAMIGVTLPAHAGTPIGEICRRPDDFAGAIVWGLINGGIGNAMRGMSVSPWTIAWNAFRYCLLWNPVFTAIAAALVLAGLGYMIYRVWPSIVYALRCRGFST